LERLFNQSGVISGVSCDLLHPRWGGLLPRVLDCPSVMVHCPQLKSLWQPPISARVWQVCGWINCDSRTLQRLYTAALVVWMWGFNWSYSKMNGVLFRCCRDQNHVSSRISPMYAIPCCFHCDTLLYHDKRVQCLRRKILCLPFSFPFRSYCLDGKEYGCGRDDDQSAQPCRVTFMRFAINTFSNNAMR
jgi:hypothetical protein